MGPTTAVVAGLARLIPETDNILSPRDEGRTLPQPDDAERKIGYPMGASVR